ncbi:adenylate/guanylate cyclase domain-containing protein [Inquilinus sp. CAU 1745]|uniref:adenylate/guanylate cyclase domain-containing protein n=1 Tax=Inquilinus sp. CAU 1745 TaxID=3140369 RepID=UPI00325B4172
MTTTDSLIERQRRASLAHIRQELLAPVTSIIGYQEIVVEEAERLGLHAILADLGRILGAVRTLAELLDRLLDPAGMPDIASDGDLAIVEAKLRHDLRTPLNAIMGYSELILDECDSVDLGALRPDIERVLTEARRLLSQLDSVVDFSRREADRTGNEDADNLAADLMRAFQPIEGAPALRSEIGRILVVDDNESNRDLLCRRLARDGHMVSHASSGRAALDMLADGEFDLVLLDLMMPDMNGYEVLTRLRADPGLREVRVIMISGIHETESIIRCVEAGAEDYLPKPCDPVLLRARISACLERKRWRDREHLYLTELKAEKERSEVLLHNILPSSIVRRLNQGERAIADRLEEVSILFCDVVGFSAIASRMTAVHLVEYLTRVFTTFDRLTLDLGIEKIKTIGDAYMAAAGLPEPRPDHAEAVAELALGMLDATDRISREAGTPLKVRIGIHTGPVVAGVIGTHKFIYDVWGDTVNLASRLESHGMPNRIHVSEAVQRILEGRYVFEPRGSVAIRDMGQISTFFLSRRAETLGPDGEI